ncbi:CRISPR-associated endonuclease Cas2 [Spirulina sp. CS-785/01]|uniref:CRISPR-associated endonuclease Cas2 n=1 Tax=Spirulina sp. CS-785/01 TaxID=3021716 RepID=UPI00232E326E|nr:CRISPR-associated endonuclease Cas2 [Spirulina sp. CS-785/01]MDB9315006.1 CRISPR-associated endonuclease Cas2 [Spirulina sp. CS-785/01]
MVLYLVVYDIPCNQRRNKVASLLEGYGQRVQYSVFECLLSESQYQVLKGRLEGRIEGSEDSVRIYPLSPAAIPKIELLGVNLPVVEPSGSVII